MIPVSNALKAAFQSDSMIKTYYLYFPEVVDAETGKVDKEAKLLTNTNLASDSITLTEPMCSEEQLHFGCNEAATFECEVEYEDESLVGRFFNVYMILGSEEEEQFNFTVGRYYVDSEEINSDRKTKSITAYDINYILNRLDITDWIYQVNYPISIKNFRDSLFDYVGLDQVNKNLINDSAVLNSNPLDGETEVNFETVIKSLCEINATFGHINREGQFDYITLTVTDNEELYPNEDIYPSSTLYPKSIKGKNYYIDPHLIQSNIVWQNYKCKTVDTVQVRNRAGGVVLEYHIAEKTTFTNIYVIQNNCLIDSFDSSTLQSVTYNFAMAIKNISYVPYEASVKMNLAFEVGDPITLTGTDGTKIPSYIFNRTMNGICSAFDEFEATGYEEWINDPPDITDGAINDLADEISDLDSRVRALEQGTSDSQIRIVSTDKLPTAPERNVLYLIQGRVTVY